MLDLQSMTVLSLRKLAREKGIKLSAGLDKEGIIARITAVLSDASNSDAPVQEVVSVQEELAPAPDEEASSIQKEAALDLPDEEDEEEAEAFREESESDEEESDPSSSARSSAPQEKPSEGPVYKAAWTNPQYNNTRSSTGPVYSTKPAWQARSFTQPAFKAPAMRQDPVRSAPPARPAGYTPRFGPDAPDVTDNAVPSRMIPAAPPPAAPARREAPEAEQESYRPAPRQDGYRPAQRGGEVLRPAYRPDTFRPDVYRQDTYRQDGYRSEGYRQEAPQADPYRQEREPYRQEPFRPETSYRQETYFRPRRDTGYYNRELGTSNPAVPEMLATGECGDGSGILEIHPEGYGFLRAENFLPGSKDVYVSIAQIRRFGLRTGDHITGKTRPQREGDKYSALLYITDVNGVAPDDLRDRVTFDDLTPIYPNKRITLENAANNSDLAIRLVDLIAPIGFGQRALIVAPPKAGKTTILSKIANAITRNYPDVHVMVLLVVERPEEVTDLRESIHGEVLASTFDELPENHIRLAEMVLERAQRLVEQKKDVVVLMDSITRLSRAYNAVAPQTGRALSGGLAPGVLHKPKRFFGAARNVKEGGSLTVIATALVETGSRMDDIIFEEFKGTGNMELVLDRELSEKRVFPAVNLQKSGTRREELLLSQKELDGVRSIRGVLSSANAKDATEQVLSMMEKTKTNADLFARLQDWITMWEKSGFVLQR
jgi:transcription termination factor Rho